MWRSCRGIVGLLQHAHREGLTTHTHTAVRRAWRCSSCAYCWHPLCRMANEGVARGLPIVLWNAVDVPKVVHTALSRSTAGRGNLGRPGTRFWTCSVGSRCTQRRPQAFRLALTTLRLAPCSSPTRSAPRVRVQPDQPDHASFDDLQARVSQRRDEAVSCEAVPRTGIQ